MKKYILLFIVPLFALAGCGSNSDSPYNPPIPPSAEFENLPNEISLSIGEEMYLHPLLVRRNVSSNNFRFISGSKNILGVNDEGKLTCYLNGETTVTVYEDENYNETLDQNEKFTIIPVHCALPSEEIIEATHVYVNSLAEDAYVGSTYSMDAFVLPSNCTYKRIKYISSDPSVSSVDENGVVKNLKPGVAIIYAYNDVSGNDIFDFSQVYNFTVFSVTEPATKYTITLPTEEAFLEVGDIFDINASVTPSTSGLYFGYDSSNKNVALASSGKISALYPGKARIEVRCEGAYAYLDVKVVEKKVNSVPLTSKIDICDDNIVMDVNENRDLLVNAVPGDHQESLKFESSNSEIVEVNSVGTLKAKKPGSTIIKVSSEQTRKFDQIVVTVKPGLASQETYFNNYYGNLTWDNSADLVNKLHNIIRNNFTPLAYANSTNWETNSYADEDINNHEMVNPLYSDDPILKTNHGNGTGKWQREHAFAASLLTGIATAAATTNPSRGTDFHNLYAADAGGNSSRSNKNFGYANIFDPTFNDSRNYHWDKYNFEPSDGDKGKVARAIFYMYVMYNNEESFTAKESWTFKSPEDVASHSTKSKTLTYTMNNHKVDIVEPYVNFSRPTLDVYMAKQSGAMIKLNEIFTEKLKSTSTFDVNSDEFRRDTYALMAATYTSNSIGNINDLLAWNTFEVDAQEIQHCESVYSHVGLAAPIKDKKQGNRNPFVDYPQLVEYVFGSLKNEPGDIKSLTPSVK